jgi:hypothetical protein
MEGSGLAYMVLTSTHPHHHHHHHHHHHYTCFQPGSLRIEQQIYLGARQASHHQAVCDHYSPSKPGPVTALKANSTRIGYHK